MVSCLHYYSARSINTAYFPCHCIVPSLHHSKGSSMSSSKTISNLIVEVEWSTYHYHLTNGHQRKIRGVEISYQLAILVFLWKQIFVSLVSLLFYLRVSSDPVLSSSQRGQGWQGRLPRASTAPASSCNVTRTVTRSLSPFTCSVSTCHLFQTETTIVKMAGLTGQGLLTWSANLWHLRKVKVYCGWLRRWPAWPQLAPCTPGYNRFLLSRYLALGVTTCPWPGSHATSSCRGHPCMVQRGRRERERREGSGRWTTGHTHYWPPQDWGLGILHKGTHFTMKRKYVILGRDYHVSVCQGSGEARRMWRFHYNWV